MESMDTDSSYIEIKVKEENGVVTNVSIKWDTTLCKLVNKYCEYHHIEKRRHAFLYKGSTVNETATPKSLGI